MKLKKQVLMYYLKDIVIMSFEIYREILKEAGISNDFDQNNYMFWKLVNSFKMMNKGNTKITELRAILQRESQNS
jgi:hypothetical protein